MVPEGMQSWAVRCCSFCGPLGDPAGTAQLQGVGFENAFCYGLHALSLLLGFTSPAVRGNPSALLGGLQEAGRGDCYIFSHLMVSTLSLFLAHGVLDPGRFPSIHCVLSWAGGLPPLCLAHQWLIRRSCQARELCTKHIRVSGDGLHLCSKGCRSWRICSVGLCRRPGFSLIGNFALRKKTSFHGKWR